MTTAESSKKAIKAIRKLEWQMRNINVMYPKKQKIKEFWLRVKIAWVIIFKAKHERVGQFLINRIPMHYDVFQLSDKAFLNLIKGKIERNRTDEESYKIASADSFQAAQEKAFLFPAGIQPIRMKKNE